MNYLENYYANYDEEDHLARNHGQVEFYHIQMELIYVDRVMYGKRDYMKVLFPDME